jgi:hypothetical protein
MKEKRNNRGSGKGRTEAGLPAYSSWLACATTSLYICNNLSPVAFSLGLQALSQGKNRTRTSQRGPVFIYIYIIIIYNYKYIYIISTHIRLIHTYPYTSNQNLRILKELTWSWHSLDLICPSFVSEAGVPVVFFALAPPVLALEAPVLVIFVGKTHSQGDVATWRMF